MWQTVLFILVAVFAVFVQSVAGFGGTLISMPFGIMLVGVAVAKPVLTIVAWITGIVMALSGWRHIDVKELIKMTLVMFVGVVLGVWLFGSFSMTYLLIIYAIIVALIGIKKFFFESDRQLPEVLQWGALAVAGLMQGMFVSGGSFLVVYAVAKIKDKKVFRATVNAVWALLNTFLIATYWHDGGLTPQVLKVSAICVVPTFLAIYLAEIFTKRINQKIFLKITYLILIASGVVLLITNL